MKIFLIRICCRWCHCCFLLCRSCYRGHVYCSQACRKAGRRHSLNQAQRRYRKTQKGKKSHMESENRRRYGKQRPCVKKMDDHTSSPRRIVPSMDACRPLLMGTCYFCGRKGWIVDAFERRKYRWQEYFTDNHGRNRTFKSWCALRGSPFEMASIGKGPSDIDIDKRHPWSAAGR